MVLTLAWIGARSTENQRIGEFSGQIPLAVVYTEAVQDDISRAIDMSTEPGYETWDARRWNTHLGTFSDKIVGLVLLRQQFSHTVYTTLTPQQRHVHDYWLCT